PTALLVDSAQISAQNDRQLVAIFLGSGHICAGCLDTATSSPDNIELPGGTQISLEGVGLKRRDQARALIGVSGGWHRADHSLTDSSPQPRRRSVGADRGKIT